FIFEAQKKVTKLLKASKYDKEVGIHFPPTNLINKLLETHDDLVISSHLTQEMLDLEEDDLIYSVLIEDKFPYLIDLILDPGEVEFLGSSSIIDFTTGEPQIIRHGSGDTS